MGSEDNRVIVDEIQLNAKDNASSVADHVAASFERLSAKVSSTIKNFALMGAGAIGVGVGIGALGRQVYSANIELEKLEKKLTGTLFAFQSWKKGMSTSQKVNVAKDEAKGVLNALDEQETRLATPLATLENAYSRVASVAFKKLGMNQQQVLDLTIRSAEAAKVYGISGEQAALTITRAIQTKTVRGFDAFSVQLRENLGNMKKLSSPQIYAKLQKSLKDLGPAAEEMATGLDASMFRIKDFFEDTIRDVGKPTFTYIAKEIEKWAKYLNQSGEGGKKLFEVYGDKLLNAFKEIQKITSLVMDNWKVIAGIWAASKGIGFLQGGVAGLAGIGGGKKEDRTGFAGIADKLGSFGSALGIATTAAYALGTAFSWWLEKQGEDNVRRANNQSQLLATGVPGLTALQKAIGVQGKSAGDQARLGVKLLRSEGIISGNQLDENKFRSMLKDSNVGTQRLIAQSFLGKRQWKEGIRSKEEMDFVVDAAKRLVKNVTASHLSAISGDVGPKVGPDWHPPVKPPVNIYGGIHITQDFKDMDPDRVMIAFKNGLETMAENVQQSPLSPEFG